MASVRKAAIAGTLLGGLVVSGDSAMGDHGFQIRVEAFGPAGQPIGERTAECGVGDCGVGFAGIYPDLGEHGWVRISLLRQDGDELKFLAESLELYQIAHLRNEPGATAEVRFTSNETITGPARLDATFVIERR